jgi:hypothetical protein
MATKKASTTTTTDLFSEPEETVVETTEVAKEEVVAPGAPETKKGRVKGTWRMHWGSEVFDFVDGTTYTLPTGLYNHLKAHGNIYDTL